MRKTIHKLSSKSELSSKYLSPLSVWALAFGCAVGWGAFVMPGTTFLPLAGPLGSIIGLLIGAGIMVIIGVNYHFLVTIQNNKKIVYLHKRNFEISNSRHADERNTNWSYAMLSRDTKNAF